MPNHFMPMGLTASAAACYMSIYYLILNHSPCYLWTLTTAKGYPDSYYGNMHSKVMQAMGNAAKQGKIPADWGGVRVVEVHPGGHGLHYHWVMRGRMDINVVREITTAAGFGRINIAQNENGTIRVVDKGLAAYLIKYLMKKGDKPHGARKWACIGTYEGVKTADIVFDSPSIAVYRAAYRAAIKLGFPRGKAMVAAKVAQRKYDHEENIV